ncbi:MAG: ABC transporter permease [Thermoplasmatota archaeon]
MTATAMLPRNADAHADRMILANEFRTAAMVWRRELIRFWRSKTRVISGLAMPLLFLVVFGTGLSSLIGSTGGVDFRKFMFPGIVAMSVVTTAIFSAVSIVWDREFGFLREMLVAPVSRTSILLGKTIGGATIATIQGAIMLVLAPFVGVRLTPLLVVEVLGVSLLMAFALTSIGAFIAARIKKMEAFQMVMQLLLFPMIFLSGAMFPLNGLPTWLTVVTRIDPITYAVDPLRRIVFDAQGFSPQIAALVASRFGSGGITLFGSTLSIAAELGMVALIGVVFNLLAVMAFSKPE